MRQVAAISEKSLHQLPAYRQVANALPRRRENRVGQGRSRRRDADFANPCRNVVPRQDVALESARERGNAGQRVIVEIALLYAAVANRHLDRMCCVPAEREVRGKPDAASRVQLVQPSPVEFQDDETRYAAKRAS